jgi:hypothetical protein
MATWTIDNVSGMDDYAAFITSEGEVAIYQGYDPAQISTWSLIGIFNIGRPIGTRCIARHESDVLCITADGITPLSKALLTDREQSARRSSPTRSRTRSGTMWRATARTTAGRS